MFFFFFWLFILTKSLWSLVLENASFTVPSFYLQNVFLLAQKLPQRTTSVLWLWPGVLQTKDTNENTSRMSIINFLVIIIIIIIIIIITNSVISIYLSFSNYPINIQSFNLTI